MAMVKLVAGALALLAACSARPLRLDLDEVTDAAARDDAGRDVQAAPGPISIPGSCDPVSQNCGGNNRCMPDCRTKTFTCQRDEGGTGGNFAVCSKHFDCRKGLACSPVDGSTPRCLQYCRSDSHCQSGFQCRVANFPCSPGEPNQLIPMPLCQERRR